MDIKEFLSQYYNNIEVYPIENGYEVAFPFKLYNDDRISSCFIKEEELGGFTVTDNGNLYRYLEENGINLKDYESKVKKICKMFHLIMKEDAIECFLGEYETNLTFIQLSNFFIGISHLATLNRLE